MLVDGMHQFAAIIKQFSTKAEMTGWFYVDIPPNISSLLMPGRKTGFRVKGHLDDHSISGVSVMPIGEGRFILPVNGEKRKGTGKEKGARLNIALQPDVQDKPLDETLLACLADEPKAQNHFDSLTRGHQRYFSNWVASAKTDPTRVKRIGICLNALSRGLDFGQMIREGRKQR